MDSADSLQSKCRKHEWIVFSTALQERWLMLQCAECGAMATVDDPTEEEWAEAYYSPLKPYRWQNVERVTLRPSGPPPSYVIRKTNSKPCECFERGLVLAPGDYERFPAEICRSRPRLTKPERDELFELAEFVGGSDLCSRLLPVFLQGFEEHSGFRHSQAVLDVVERIRGIDQKGMHMSAKVVAQVLGSLARRDAGGGPAAK